MSEIHFPKTCDDIPQSGMLSVEQARQKILQQMIPVSGVEALSVVSALGRVLSADIISAIDVPGHDSSAMDGYALRGTDLSATDKTEFQLIGTTYAGHPFPGEVSKGECVRIMTGAAMPAGADTVVMQELVELTPNGVAVSPGQQPGQHVRKAGNDINQGSRVLPAGRQLSAADLGVIASLGQAEVEVSRRLRVAFFSTGDELCPLGESLQPGQIHDSNRYTLNGLLQSLGVEMIDLGIVPDDPDQLRKTLLSASSQADAVITSGGVSVGEADYIKALLDELGEVDIWKVAMKPGKPLTFGGLQGSWFFGLPGNPVSVMVTFTQFVRPALQKLMGMMPMPALQLQLPCGSALRKQPGRAEYQRGILQQDESGRWMVFSTGAQDSGMLSSMSQANCFIVLPAASPGAEAGELVTVEPFQA